MNNLIALMYCLPTLYWQEPVFQEFREKNKVVASNKRMRVFVLHF